MEKKSSRHNTTPIFYLKANLACCEACPRKVRNYLQKQDGVFAFDIDPVKGLVSVSGPVDPQVVLDKIRKWKSKVLLCSPPKSGKSPTKKDAESYSNDHDSQFDSDSDDHDENCDLPGKRSGQHPERRQEKPDAAPASTPQKVKKRGLFSCMFGKDKGGTRPQGTPSSGPRPQFANPGPNSVGFGQRRPMMMPPQYGPPRPNYPPEWGRPPQYGMPQFPPFYQARYPPPPPPLPGGVFQSRQPPSQYNHNPMTHYTSYEDNYYYR